jgi:tetratricopeptide (TPR) repeat protein
MIGRIEVYKKAMTQGHSAAWDQDWKQAASFYRKALGEFPKDAQALASLGLALIELQQYAEALQIYKQAVESSPDDPAPYDRISLLSESSEDLEPFLSASLRAADLYLQRGEYEKAIENLSRVSRRDLDNREAHSHLAVIYERLGRKQQAVVEYMAVASLFQRSQDLDRANQALQRALLISPNSREVKQAIQMLGESRMLPKPTRSKAATGPLKSLPVEPEGKKALETETEAGDPVVQSRDKALANLAALIFEEKELEQILVEPVRPAKKEWKFKPGRRGGERKLDRSTVVLHISQMVDFHARGQMKEAGEELEQVLAAGLESEAVFFGLGYLFSKVGELDKAEHYLKYSLRSEVYALASHLLFGLIYSQTDRIDQAALEYLEALKLAEVQVVPAGQADGFRKRYDVLIAKEAKRDDLQAKGLLCESISSLLLQSNWRDRLTNARRELSIEMENILPVPLGELLAETGNSKVIDSIATINRLARAGNLRSAMEEVLFALMYAPTYLPLHIIQGEILLREDQVLKAVEKFRVVAQVYESRGETNLAIELLRRIIHLAPMNIESRSQMIDMLVIRKDGEAAVDELVGLANVYYDLADLDRAQETYKKAFLLASQYSLSPKIRVPILHQIADIQLQCLDWRNALLVYEQVRDLDTEDEKARANLVQLNMRLGQKNKAMEELINYLSLLIKQGQQEQAILFVEKLASDNPDQENLQRILADLYRQVGKGVEEAGGNLEPGEGRQIKDTVTTRCGRM